MGTGKRSQHIKMVECSEGDGLSDCFVQGGLATLNLSPQFNLFVAKYDASLMYCIRKGYSRGVSYKFCTQTVSTGPGVQQQR